MAENNLQNGKCPMCGSTLFHVVRIGTKITIKCYRTKNCGWTQEALMTKVPDKMPSKTLQERREHLRPYKTQALDSAIKFFMSYYYGKKHRNDKLGAEWDVII